MVEEDGADAGDGLGLGHGGLSGSGLLVREAGRVSWITIN